MVLNFLSEWYLAENQRFGILEFFNRIGQKQSFRHLHRHSLSVMSCKLFAGACWLGAEQFCLFPDTMLFSLVRRHQ
jgi:hypothetical protein